VLLLAQGCASSGPGAFSVVAPSAEGEWEYVEAGPVNEVGDALPRHVRIVASVGRVALGSEARRTGAFEAAGEGRLVLFCDRRELQYHFGEALHPLTGGRVSVQFDVRTHVIPPGTRYPPSRDRILVDQDRMWTLHSGGWATQGPHGTARFIDAAVRGAEVRFSVVGGRGGQVIHSFLLEGFTAALSRCDGTA